MALNTVTLTWDLADLIQSGISATITLVPTAVLTDATDHVVIPQVTRSRVFDGGTGSLPGIIACDNGQITPAGWAYTITVTLANGTVLLSFTAFINFANGATQDLSTLTPAVNAVTWVPAVGTPVFSAAPAAGATATDTASIQAAITRMTAAGGHGTLQLQDGTYQVDGNALVIRNCSNFAVKGTGATVIAQAPNRAGLPNNVTGDLMVIADCTDFRVEGITFDGLRDTVAPLTPLTAPASSGQPSVTVAAGQGANYIAGQHLGVNGGLGSGDQNKFDKQLTIASITPGGGSGGGDLITFTGNLSNTYSVISPAAVSDGFGPYAYAGAYVSPYQTSGGVTVAGRGLNGEDQQNGLHLISCQRFVIDQCTARNVWESPFRLGTGYIATSLTDGCSQGTVSGCTGYHAYDQGVAVWVSKDITVTGCVLNATGWASISLTGSDDCAVVGNQCLNSVYRVWANTAGSGLVTEGGLHNLFKDNVVMAPYANGVRLTTSPLGWGVGTATSPTTSTYLTAQTAAGTSIQVSSTANLQQGGLYSIVDGARTEAVTVASIVDGTHVTFSGNLRFSHPAGVPLTFRVAQENVLEGNTIAGVSQFSAVLANLSVRSVIKDNVIRDWALGSGGGPGSGIEMQFSSTGSGILPSGVTLAGQGANIEGNVIGGGGGRAILLDSGDSYSVRGNRLYGTSQPAGSFNILQVNGVTDSVIEGNYISDSQANVGLLTQAGTQSSQACARLAISDNVITRCFKEGMRLTSGDSLAITGNVVTSCGGNAGIDLRGITRSIVEGNVCNSNQADGILLEDNGGTFCQWNRVTGNTTRDDGSGINVATGGTWTQQHGIVEAGTSNNNLFTGNESDANAIDSLTTAGAASYAFANTLTGTIRGNLPIAVGGTGQATDPLPAFQASDAGFLAWNYDPLLATAGSAPANNTLVLIRVQLRIASTVTNCLLYVTTVGSGLVSSQNFTGLYNSSGTLIAASADQTTTWGSSTGLKTAALPGGPYSLAAGFYWVAVLANQSAGTVPQFLRTGTPQSSASYNLGLTASTSRCVTNGTGTSLPGSITPSSNVQAGQVWWAALS